jgi:4-amino-4-deoxy-L-arabinose transferase-like glycosyltransferase
VKVFLNIMDITVTRLERWLVAVVVLVSFAAQFITLRVPTSAGEEYQVAQNIAGGIGYALVHPGDSIPLISAFVAPLYVWSLLGVMKLGGSVLAFQLVNLGLLQLGNFFCYRIARRFASPSAAFAGFGILSFFIPLWVLASAIEPHMLNHALLSAMVLLMVIIHREPMKRGVYLLLGLVIGLQLLSRPDMLWGFVILGAWFGWMLKRELDKWRLVKKLTFTAIVIVFVAGPWSLRNYLVFDRFIPVTASGGYALFAGNNPAATEFGTIKPDADNREVEKIHREAAMLSPVKRNDFYVDKATAWMGSEPGGYLLLASKKFAYHWIGPKVSTFKSGVLKVASSILSVIIVGLGIFGLLSLRDKYLRWMFIALFAYSAALSVIYFVEPSNRAFIMDPYLVTLAAYGLSVLLLRESKQSGKPDVVSPERLALSKN